ncbi:GNAT family N-acetyltransferase [Halorarum halobium]|uniref:GNAT family N-acetyltransferase n=1 Tax=Halorarum halobium TaxID=3075121 RepID=UPI0028AA5D1D|nr:GNAT family N-acetyltransferase [Halobaculum sp. XH14]
MYVRDARNRDEVWLLDHIEEMGLDEGSFRSRDYVIAVEEGRNDRAGFGRFRLHKTDGGDFCELTSIGVLPAWRGQGVGAHILERLVDEAGDDGFDVVYCFTETADYLTQFGFEAVEESALPEPMRERLGTVREQQAEAVPLVLKRESFAVPGELREAFKNAKPMADEPAPEPEDTAEDFGIDPDEATYKYDTGG